MPTVIDMGQRKIADAEQLAFGFGSDGAMDALSLADTTFVVVDLETTGGRATAKTPGAG
ncbi:hypothetical protein ACNQR9_32185 [Mycolicibacterium peregrinum]